MSIGGGGSPKGGMSWPGGSGGGCGTGGGVMGICMQRQHRAPGPVAARRRIAEKVLRNPMRISVSDDAEGFRSMGRSVQQSLSPPVAAPAAARRGFSLAAKLAPHRLRALVRGEETALVALAALVGGIAGLLVVGMNRASEYAHVFLFGLTPGTRLSAQPHIESWRALLVPCAGGLAMGGITLLLARLRPRRAVDPIEANALYGGKMSMPDSLGVVAQTMLSNGVGASVGLEAAYT
jgi:hypothetical protein